MDDTTPRRSLIPAGSANSHPLAWIVMIFSIFFTAGTVVWDAARLLLGWEAPSRGLAYFIPAGITIVLFFYVRSGSAVSRAA